VIPNAEPSDAGCGRRPQVQIAPPQPAIVLKVKKAESRKGVAGWTKPSLLERSIQKPTIDAKNQRVGKWAVTVKGPGTDCCYINPHCQVYFDIKKSKGEVERWQAELTAPNELSRAGWTRHSLNPGDQITVTGFQGKNGGHSIWIRKLIGPDGHAMQLPED